MARTITALFDTRADADAGAERLRQAGIDAEHIAVHDRLTHSAGEPYSTSKDRGFWASIRNTFLPHEDRHTYEEGVRRGGVLLTADVADEDTPAAVQALEDANTVDLDARSAQWRSEGWNYADRDTVFDDGDDGVLYGSRESGVGGVRYRSYVSGGR